MHPVIQQIYDSNEANDFSISKEEGTFIGKIIADDPSVRRTLEVGCAAGVSSLFICAALAGRPSASHTILDPNQTSQWKDAGLHNLERAGFDFFTLEQAYSEFALPQKAQAEEGAFDFVFIDGWHTFDHTLLDVFYANRLLRVGGYLVIDDTDFPAINRVVSYLSKYPAYRVAGKCQMSPTLKRRLAAMVFGRVPLRWWPRPLVNRIRSCLYPSMVCFQKIASDVRSWDWYADF